MFGFGKKNNNKNTKGKEEVTVKKPETVETNNTINKEDNTMGKYRMEHGKMVLNTPVETQAPQQNKSTSVTNITQAIKQPIMPQEPIYDDVNIEQGVNEDVSSQEVYDASELDAEEELAPDMSSDEKFRLMEERDAREFEARLKQDIQAQKQVRQQPQRQMPPNVQQSYQEQPQYPQYQEEEVQENVQPQAQEQVQDGYVMVIISCEDGVEYNIPVLLSRYAQTIAAIKDKMDTTMLINDILIDTKKIIGIGPATDQHNQQ
jgi:hypothetical protein